MVIRALMWMSIALAAAVPPSAPPPSAPPPADPLRGRLGGPATVDEQGPNAFSLPVPALSTEDRRAFSVGNALFRDNWVAAPASVDSRDGLGPLFNANSCSACHQEDGRGRPPERAGEVGLGLVVFVSPEAMDGAPHPTYGKQLQDQAVTGVPPEVALEMKPTLLRGSFDDGESWEMRRLDVVIDRPAYGPVGAVRTSARIGPQLIGGGLLEAVPDAAIVAREDIDDRDGDGISGRAHRLGESGRVGRFGWKASQPTLDHQVRAALHEDIGITSAEHPSESLTVAQRGTVDAPSGGSPEIDAHRVARIAHYCRTLAVPAQRGIDSAAVMRGQQVFAEIGCSACHVPELKTDQSSPVPQLRGVAFQPFTDLLLHDMGDGLADHRADGEASGREWRTPPLWGIGLLETVNGHANYLHDGRARTLQEAVLWHGGEAERARTAFTKLPKSDREAILAFLRSL